MKRFIYAVIVSAGLAACSDHVQKDLINYYNTELPKITQLEEDAMAAYAGIAGANYQNDSVMYVVLKDTVIPKYSEFYDGLQAIKPSTADVQKMHSEYIEAAKDQLEAFKLIIEAIDKQDEEVIKVANGDFEKAKIALDEWKAEFEEIRKKHNVVMEGEGDSK
ncbi:MAG TPA: hypothetical protein VG737_05315 [Cyclobacteriaceae bacterium]|nr:hypothetical protein [Cyclobacteriaceae bacterium]